jgi:predicted enzyme related to lactoylglutathione lyase
MTPPTQFASTRIFTDDVDALLDFYVAITGVAATRLHPLFGEIATALGTLAIASTTTVGLLGEGAAASASNHSVSLDFLVEDVDALLPSLREIVTDFVNEPTDLPWGNRSLLFRDPDGNLINFFTPTTAAARERFGLSR